MAATARNWPERAAVALLLWGAAVAWLGFPSTGFWPLALIGPAPLMALAAARPARAFAYGYAYGLGFFAGLLYWLVHTLHVYGWLPLVVSIPLYLLLVAYLALSPALASWLMVRAGRGEETLALALAPFAFTGLEWVRAHFLSGFGWGEPALALWEVRWALDLAPRIGALGVSFLAFALASVLAWLFLFRARVAPRPGPGALLTAGVALAALVALRFVPDGVGEPVGTLRAAVIQGNVDQGVKWDPGFRDRTIAGYRDLTAEALAQGPADVVLWPETAAPFWIQDASPSRSAISDIAQRAGCDLILGAPAYAPDAEDRTHRNSVFRMDRQGKLRERYDKMHLVPFGEYVPFGRNLPFLHTLTQASGNFIPGTEMTLLPLEGGKGSVGPLICFESLFPEYAAQHARNGAQALALVTNDAWFGDTSAPHQHLAYAAWRAAETGLPLLRAANTGVSAAFDARGNLLARTELLVPATLRATLEVPRASLTPHTRWGGWLGPLCLAAPLFVMLCTRRGRSRRHRLELP